MYLKTKIVKGKHFKVYEEAKKFVPTKAELLRRALKKVERLATHEEWIDFIPAIFTLQLHGWEDKGIYKNLKEVKNIISDALKKKIDPIVVLKGKWHYDLRVLKKGAPAWFGFTLFRAPWTGKPEDKCMGTVKGYQSIVKGGKELQEFLRTKAEAAIATAGVAERRDRPEWLDIKAAWWDPEKGPAAAVPTYQPGQMIAVEFHEPCVVHRRELDFIDITFLGKYLNGRYFYRLVERKLSKDELTKWQIESGKTYYGLGFYFWRSKRAFDPKTMLEVAKGKKILDPIPVDDQEKYTEPQPPLKEKWKYRRKEKILET